MTKTLDVQDCVADLKEMLDQLERERRLLMKEVGEDHGPNRMYVRTGWFQAVARVKKELEVFVEAWEMGQKVYEST
jgi:hypothetical protein